MRHPLIHLSAALLAAAALGGSFLYARSSQGVAETGGPFLPADIRATAPQEFAPAGVRDPADDYADWVRPEGPLRVGLQAGHWQTNEVPDELFNLRGHGASGGGKEEWEVNLAIANSAAAMLRADGYEVDVLPATIPPKYFADVFVSVHADEHPNRKVSGYKVTSSHLGLAQAESDVLARALSVRYADATHFKDDREATENMTEYYAFNWRKFTHSLHPMTPAVIIETGFMTNANDRKIIIKQPQIPARAIAAGVRDYLTRE